MHNGIRRGTALPLALTAALTLLLAGCGFHLRGHGSVSDDFRTVTIRETGDSASGSNWYAGGRDDLRRAVTGAFTDSGFVVSGAAPITVELLGESINRSIASIDASASAAEYQVDYELTFRVTAADGSNIVPETSLTADRSYRYHENAVMGSADEEALLYQEMRRDIAAQLVRHYRRSIVTRGAADAATTATTVIPAPATGATPASADAPAP